MHPEASPTIVSRELTDALAARLGTQLDSVIAHGSWVHGDFCPGRSDLDLLVILCDEPGPDFVSAVEPILSQITERHPAWRDRLELGFVTRRTIQAVLHGHENTHRVGRVSPGEPLHLVPADRHRLLDWGSRPPRHNPVREAGSGGAPLVPPDNVRAVVLEHLHSWPTWLAESERPGYQAYAVLTVSRAAAYLATGERHSKRAGAGWAATHFPTWRPLLEWATQWWYADGTDDQKPPPGVSEFVAELAGSHRVSSALRPMRADDVDKVIAVQEEGAVSALGHIFPQDTNPFPREAVRERWTHDLAGTDVECFVIEAPDHTVQGFAALRGDELLHFGTAKASWGSGLARRAHDEILDHWRELGLDRARLRVFEANHHARHFYEHRGWTVTDQRTRSGFAPHPVLLGYERQLL